MNLRIINLWLAIGGTAISWGLTLYIWAVVGSATGLLDLCGALAQCALVGLGGYLAAGILLSPGLERFGKLALLLPGVIWVITLGSLVAVVYGNRSMSPMLIYPLLLPIQMVLLALGAVLFEVLFMISRYLTSPSTTTSSAPSGHQQQPDYIFLAVLCVCVLIVPAIGAGVMSLQRLLPPADAVLSGPTADGQLLFVIPVVVLGCLAAFRIAWTLTRRIRRGLRMPDKDPLPVAAWAKPIYWQSINWRLVAGIAGVILMLIAAKGFGSYFYVTESSVSVRAPLQFSMRHYAWNDVITVRVQCRNFRVKPYHRFRYVLEMSDGQEVDLSYAFFSVSPKFRAASAVRFAEFIPSHLNTVPSIRYEFDVSQDALVSLGEKHGVILSNALREQVLTHGGTLQ